MKWTPPLVGICVALLGVLAWQGFEQRQQGVATGEVVAHHLQRAGNFADSGDLGAARVAIEAAHALAPQSHAVQRALMTLQVRAAAEFPETVVASDLPALRVAIDTLGSETAMAQVATGQLAARAGRAEEAAAAFSAALAARPEFVPALLARGGLERSAGRLVEAQAAFEKARDLSPQNVTALNNLGVVYMDLGRVPDAIGVFEAALAVRDNAASRANLAAALAHADRAQEAITHLQRAVALDPATAELHRQLGAAMQRKGDLDGAERALSRAGELDRSSQVAYELALIYQAQKRYDRAAATLRRALAADPENLDAAYQLGATLQTIGDGEGAARALQHYLRVSSSNPAEAERRAQVLSALSPAPAPAPAEPPAAPASPE